MSDAVHLVTRATLRKRNPLPPVCGDRRATSVTIDPKEVDCPACLAEIASITADLTARLADAEAATARAVEEEREAFTDLKLERALERGQRTQKYLEAEQLHMAQMYEAFEACAEVIARAIRSRTTTKGRDDG